MYEQVYRCLQDLLDHSAKQLQRERALTLLEALWKSDTYSVATHEQYFLKALQAMLGASRPRGGMSNQISHDAVYLKQLLMCMFLPASAYLNSGTAALVLRLFGLLLTGSPSLRAAVMRAMESKSTPQSTVRVRQVWPACSLRMHALHHHDQVAWIHWVNLSAASR
jgi:hypothetical protein